MDAQQVEIENINKLITVLEEKKKKIEEDIKNKKPKRGRPRKPLELDNVAIDNVHIRDLPSTSVYISKGNDKRGRKVVWTSKKRELVSKIKKIDDQKCEELLKSLS